MLKSTASANWSLDCVNPDQITVTVWGDDINGIAFTSSTRRGNDGCSITVNAATTKANTDTGESLDDGNLCLKDKDSKL